MIKLLFVLGVYKTGTSTICGMLNSHPELFVFFEAFNRQSKSYNRRKEVFCGRFSEFSSVFEQNQGIKFHKKALKKFEKMGYNYKYMGDKISGFSNEWIEPIRKERVIVTIRDLRTWLCKDFVMSLGKSPAVFATDYVKYYLNAQNILKDPLMIKMEDVVKKNAKVKKDIANFLDVDSQGFNAWWNKVGQWKLHDPKAHWPWWKKHPSSKLRPHAADTKAVLKDIPFWKEILPIFDDCYNGDVSRAGHKIKLLNEIQHKYRGLSYRDCYEQIAHINLTTGAKK